MIGFGRKYRIDIEGRGLGFVSLIDLAGLDEVFVALNCMLIPSNEEVGKALYLIPLRKSVVGLFSPATAIRTPLEWKYCDLPICSSVPGINSGLICQGLQPLIDKSPVHNGAMRGLV